jgi:hypothetical protein
VRVIVLNNISAILVEEIGLPQVTDTLYNIMLHRVDLVGARCEL